MDETVRILIVEDLEADADLAQREIRKSVEACEFKRVETGGDFLKALDAFQPDLVLSDYNLPRFDGMKALELVLEHSPLTPLIIWTGSMSEDVAVGCMKAGANNYIIKENIQRLGPAVIHALEERRLRVEQKQAEEKYQAIFEGSPVGIFQSTPKGRFLNVNPAMAHIYGYDSPQDMVDSITDIARQIYPEQDQREEFRRLFETQDVVENFEWKNVRKDGSIFWTSTSARAVRDAEGKIQYYEGFLQDITEHKQITETVREQEEHFRALIENSFDNISLLSADGTLLWENPAVNRTLGYEQDEHVGRNIFELIHPDDLHWTTDKFTTLVNRPGEHEAGIFRLKHQNGSWRWIEAVGTNLLNEPSVRAIVINYRDITERKQAEIEIQNKNDDLGLVTAINEAVIRGESLDAIVVLLGKEMKRIFSSVGSTVYMLSSDKQFLTMQQFFMSSELTRRIEQLIGSTIPLVYLPIREGSYFQQAINSNTGRITSGPEEIQKWIEEFVETTFLPPVAQKMLRKLVPQIYNLLNIKSVITVPLISDGMTIGLLDVSGSYLFSDDDLRRILSIAGHLTAAIQRQQANEKIRRSQEFLQSIQNALSANIAILDEEGTIVQVNSAWRKFGDLNGLNRPDACIGMNYLEVCDSARGDDTDEAAVVAALIRDVISGQRKSAQIEYPCHSPDERRWYDLRITKFEDGDRIWVVLAHENVTEKKEAENTIRDLARFPKENPNPVLRVTHDGQIVYANAGGNNWLNGWGTTIGSRLPTQWVETISDAYRKKEKQIVEFEIQDSVFSTLIVPITEAGYVNLYGRDITERKRAEEALVENEARYRGLFENSPVAIWEEDFSEVKNYIDLIKEKGISDIRAYFESHPEEMVQCKKMVKIADINNAALKMYEANSKEELIQVAQSDFSSGELEHLIDDLVSVADGKTTNGWEGRDETLTGRPIEISLIRSVVPGHEADYSKVIVTTTDITASKRAEDALKRREAIMSAVAFSAQELIGTMNWEETIPVVLESLGKATGADRVYIFQTHTSSSNVLLTSQRHEWVSAGIESQFDNTDLKNIPMLDSGFSRWVDVLQNRNEIHGLVRDVPTSEQELLDAQNILSLAVVPIFVGDQWWGFIGFDDCRKERKWEDTEIDALKIAAGNLGSAIQRHDYEKALRESEERFHSLFDRMLDGVYRSTHEGRFMDVNPAMVKMFGFSSREEMLEVDIKNELYFSPDERGSHLLDSGQEEVDVYRMRRRDGSEIWVEDHGSYVHDDQGNIIYHEGILRDITERKQAEQALLQSEKRYRTVVENQKEFIVRWKSNGIRTFVNDAYCQYFGVTQEEALSNSFLPLIHEDDLQAVEAKISRLLSEESSSETDVHRVIKSDGSIGWQEWTDQAIYDEHGVVIEYQSVGRDITEQKQAENALRESQFRYRSLFENSPISLWEEDFSQVKAYFDDLRDSGVVDFRTYFEDHLEAVKECTKLVKILDVNRATLDLLEIDNKSELGGTLDASLSEEALANVKEEFISLAEGNPTYEGEEVFHTMKGERREILFSLTVAPGYEESLAKVLVSIIDITERKMAENAERDQRAMAEALRDTAEVLNSTLEYEDILDHILTVAGRVVPHDTAAIMLINDGNAYVARSQGFEERGFDAEIMGLQLSITETTNLRQMFETKQPVFISDTQTYPGWKKLPTTDWLRSNIGAPISISGDVIGFILLDSEKPGFFNSDHADRLISFANQAALAIHNSRLLRQAQDEISERKQVEEALRARDLLLHMSQKIARLGHYDLDIRTGVWESSTVLNDILGIDNSYQTDVEGWVDLVHPSQQSEMRDYFLSHVLENHNPFDQEYKIIRKSDQQERWVHGLGRLEFDDMGAPVRLIGTIQDITERKRAEDELKRSHSLLNAALEATKDGFLVVGTDRKISSFNRKFLELWKIPYSLAKKRDEKFLLDFVRDQLKDPDAFVSYVEKLYLTPEAESSYEVEFKDGRIFEQHSQPQQLREEIVGRVWSFRDITERKRAEKNLRASEERFRQLADNIQEVFWMTDAVTGDEIYLSPASEKIWGRSVEAMLRDKNLFIETILPEDRQEVLETLNKQRDGQNTEIEYRIALPDGTVRWIWDRAFPIFDDAGKVVRLAGIAADVTDRKQAEERTERHLSELEALYENGLAVSRLLEPREIGERIILTFNRYLSWHHVTIRLLKNGTDEMELVAYSLPHMETSKLEEAGNKFTKHISKVGQGLSGWVVQTGQPIRTGNVHNHPQYVDVYEGIKSGLYMPLTIGKQTIGVISVESEEPDAFSPQDERLLATLANQAAIALENARLYQTAQQELNERKRVENALRVSEAHYRDLADSITDILFELDQDMRYIHWNKASEMLTGIPEEKAIGMKMADVFGESDEQKRVEGIYKNVLKTHQSRSFETVFKLNNEKLSFEINAYPSNRGVAVVAKDVTESKQTEILLQKRFELMEFSAHHSLDELMQKIMDDVCELTGSLIGFFHFLEEDQNTLGTQTWSTNALKLFNVPVSEGEHRPLDQAGAWAEAARQRRSLIHNDFKSIPQIKGTPKGHLQIERTMVVPIIRNENIVAVMGVANKRQDYSRKDLEAAERLIDYAWDVTERKQMQTALADERNQLAERIEERTAELIKANSNLARALRVKDEFLANMSHELRTPLNAILGLSESLTEQIAGPLNNKQLKYLTTIGESGHHLLSLINDILDLAKIEAGQITLDINKVDIHSVCQASLRMVKQLAQKKNQKLTMEVDKNLSLMWADERRLKQMIVNLLSNAVKFTPENGALGLEVHVYEEENRAEISVWDKGIGISEENLARLFKPFVQVDSGLARESSGTGLGLALVSQMARLHGGSVTATSQLGKGSRFTIKLPWEPALARDPVERLKNTGRLGSLKSDQKNKKNILLIEDTSEVVMMIQDYLETAGYAVTTAQDGIEGINQASLIHPDLIIMDIQMPRLDGIEATKRLRTDPEFRTVPIIALTALAMQNDRERCLEAGMNDYISKPVNLKALVKTIQKHLSFEEEKTLPL